MIKMHTHLSQDELDNLEKKGTTLNTIDNITFKVTKIGLASLPAFLVLGVASIIASKISSNQEVTELSSQIAWIGVALSTLSLGINKSIEKPLLEAKNKIKIQINEQINKNGSYNINGEVYWYKNDKLHREDGPAYESNNAKEWWLNGERHREDGPAIIWSNGAKEFWLKGIQYSEGDFKSYLNKKILNQSLQLNLNIKQEKYLKSKI